MRATAASIACLLALSSPARAAKELGALIVLPVVSGDAPARAIEDAAARAASDRVGLELVRRGGDPRAIIGACGSDLYCVAGALRSAELRYALLITVNTAVAPVFVSLHLIDRAAGGAIAERAEEFDGSDLARAIEARVDALLDGAGFPRAGRLVVEIDPAGASLRLSDGTQPDGGAGNVFTLVPGKYELVAAAQGYEEARSTAIVNAREATSVSIALERDSIVHRWWFWTGIAAVVAGGTAAAIIATRPGTTVHCFCGIPERGVCTLCAE